MISIEILYHEKFDFRRKIGLYPEILHSNRCMMCPFPSIGIFFAALMCFHGGFQLPLPMTLNA